MQPPYPEVIIFFIAANIIVVGLGIFFFFIIRIQQKRKQLFQKQLLEKEYKTREEALLQVSRDLHDDIGSSLSGINMLSQLAQQQMIQSGNSLANELLQKINVYTSEVIEKVSDMAWLLKPNQESVSILVKKIKAYGLATAASKNIQLHFDDTIESAAKEFSIQQRKAIYLISKEAINNAVKYAECKNIYCHINLAEHQLNLLIKDDGKGFYLAEVNEGNGLKNMQARAEEIKAEIRINSEPGKGTAIELEL
jgi:signal transduction histidine kinase